MEGTLPRHTSQEILVVEQSALRILALTADLAGGTGAHFADLVKQWPSKDVWLSIFCHGNRDVPLPEHVEYTARNWSGRPSGLPFAQLRDYRQARAMAGQLGPDIVHAFFFWPIMYGRLLKSTGSVARLVENREDQGFNWGPMEYRLLRATAHIPDRVICVSDAVRDVVMAREGLRDEQAVTIRNGISMPKFPPGPSDVAELRVELGLHPDNMVVGMVANMNRAVKGVRYFIESLPRIVEAVPRARFVIVGQGEEAMALRARSAELGVSNFVTFAGYRRDVNRFYALMDVSVLTSLSEGLSITILESMSHGVPVVATRVGGNPEIVEDGETGLLVPAKDPEAFADAVIRVLNSPSLASAMGESGRARVSEDLSIQSVAQSYARLYADVVMGRPD